MASTVTRVPNGITNNAPESILADLGVLDPTKWHQYFDDFDTYKAADWTITSVGAATQALQDLDGGSLLLTNAAADNDSTFLQIAKESFLFASGKKIFFKARLKVSDATQSDFICGLQITDTTPLDVTDGVFFQKDDGDANLDFHVEKDNTATSATAIATVANDTFLTIEFAYDGVSTIKYGVNGTVLGSSVTTNLPDDEVLTVSFGIQNGEAVAKTMSIDYIFVAKER
jgi:hypothetical protein